MATQVEALLPGTPLLPADEPGLLLRAPQEKGEPLMPQGEKEEGSGVAPDGCGKGGGAAGEPPRRSAAAAAGAPRPPSIKQQKEESNNQEKENLLQQRGGAENRLPGEAGGGGEEGGGEQGGGGRKEFIEAPPPKVNPWTKNAQVAVVTVNGQGPPGQDWKC